MKKDGEEIIRLGRGGVLVENPSQAVKDGLRRFVHRRGGGSYENLYALSPDGRFLVTVPGFANRVKRLAPTARVLDARRKMPTPLLDLAVVGLEPWADAVVRAVGACGGVVSVPDILGTAPLAAAILRAFPRDGLLDRGTPLSVIATKDGPSARALADQLREILPDREIGFTASDKYTESEDIVVTPYTEIFGYQAQYAGILIGDDLTAVDFLRRDRRIAPIGSAARWGIRSTAAGGAVELDMDVEGVFGPLVASIAYDDVVKAGIAVPLTVVWLPCPRPKEYLGSAPLGVLAETAMPRNKAFVGIVAEILDSVPDGMGFVMSPVAK